MTEARDNEDLNKINGRWNGEKRLDVRNIQGVEGEGCRKESTPTFLSRAAEWLVVSFTRLGEGREVCCW